MSGGMTTRIWKGPGRTWNGGKSDDLAIAQAHFVLMSAGCEIPYESIHVEPSLLLPRDEADVVPAEPTFAEEAGKRLNADASDRLYVRRHPDLCVTIAGVPRLVVEMDGSWHDTPPGRKATDRRDRSYRDAGIELVAIRLSEYPDGLSWQENLAVRAARKYRALLALDDDDDRAQDTPDTKDAKSVSYISRRGRAP